MNGPMEGIRVVELGVWVAGPCAGMILADWGAEVIKVEPPGGDPYREIFSVSAGVDVETNPPFEMDNRGKRSITVDISKPEGAAIVADLAAEADVFVTNARVLALERAGLDYEDLAARNPRLIYARVTGFGEDVPAVRTPDDTPEERNRRAIYVLSAGPPAITDAIPAAKWRPLR